MFNLRRIVAIIVLAVFVAAAHAQQTLRVAAAADLQPLLPKILAEFSAQTGIHTEASYKSSATLATAIINGAPFDLFLAADFSFPQRVIDAGRAEESKPIAYARGTLVLWSRNDGPFGTLSVDSLRSPALHSLAIANPQHAPYGRAAVASLRHMGLYDSLKTKLVIAENIAQAAQFADSGNAQLGFISLTSALTPRLKASGHFVAVPGSDYPPILQGGVVIKNSPNAKAAHQFLNYLASGAIARQLEAGGLATAR
ncbi:MAG: molybdate ABC transporter substrate-binding protein [Acidobacteriaceae bacterium]